MIYKGLNFTHLTATDISILTPIMKRSFDYDAKRSLGKETGGPPGYDNGSFLRKWGMESDAIAYTISLNNTVIGAVMVFINLENNSGFLGNLFIDGNLIGKGYGYIAWQFIENQYPQIKTWETETPAVSYLNHRFYINKCGFQVYAVEGGMDKYEAMFKLRKTLI